jgi:hypothetical protein
MSHSLSSETLTTDQQSSGEVASVIATFAASYTCRCEGEERMGESRVNVTRLFMNNLTTYDLWTTLTAKVYAV